MPAERGEVLLPHTVVRTHWSLAPDKRPAPRPASQQGQPLTEADIAAMNAVPPRDAYDVAYRQSLRQIEYRLVVASEALRPETMTDDTLVNGRPWREGVRYLREQGVQVIE